MKTYLIGYDLNKPRENDDYKDLIEAIKEYGTWWHHLDSTWIIKTNQSAVEIRDKLKKHIDTGDELLVVRLRQESAWTGFNKKGSDWLMDNLTDD
jgi:hypothetical protein